MIDPPVIQYASHTDVGMRRAGNQDALVVKLSTEFEDWQNCGHLFCVADGMGGLGFGEVASAITVHTLTSMVKQGHGVNQAIEVAHNRIKEYSELEGHGTNMGTTLVLLLTQGSVYNVFWVGDSRAYLLEKEGMRQLTVDHSLVQTLIDQGELTVTEAASHEAGSGWRLLSSKGRQRPMGNRHRQAGCRSSSRAGGL